MNGTKLSLWACYLPLIKKTICCSDEALHTPQMDELEGRPFSGKSSFRSLMTLFRHELSVQVLLGVLRSMIINRVCKTCLHLGSVSENIVLTQKEKDQTGSWILKSFRFNQVRLLLVHSFRDWSNEINIMTGHLSQQSSSSQHISGKSLVLNFFR